MRIPLPGRGYWAKKSLVELPIPSEQLASMLIAMAAGIAMERELDPKSVPDDTYALILQYFFRGMAADAEPAQAETAALTA